MNTNTCHIAYWLKVARIVIYSIHIQNYKPNTKNKAVSIKFDYTTHIKVMEIMSWQGYNYNIG